MPRRVLQGRVVSATNAKTITVSVERRFRHPAQQKIVRRNSKYRAHDPEGTASVGDRVRIEECAPVSRSKHWRLVAVESGGKD